MKLSLHLALALTVGAAPTGNINGLCNQNDAEFFMRNQENPGGRDDCDAKPHSFCQTSEEAWIPWAQSAEDLEHGHHMGISSDLIHWFCIWRNNDEEKIYGAPNCQYSAKRELAKVPGVWRPVVSPAGDVSLWEPQLSPCPDEPRTCTVNKSMGQWLYKYTISGTVTETWKHGTTKTHEESKTEEWTESMSVSVDAGFKFLGMGTEITITGGFAHSTSSTHQDEWSITEEEDFSITFDEAYWGKAAWQFIFSEFDTCLHQENTLTREFAVTANAMDEPCCLPGYAADAPKYKVCLSEKVMLPNGKEHGCSVKEIIQV